ARLRFLNHPRLPEELAILRRLAESSLEHGDLEEARSALLIALSINDCDVATRVLWARLLSASGQRGRARRAWRLAARLDEQQQFAPEIREALQRLDAA